MMKILQMTKFFLKKQRLGGLDFTKGWILSEQEMVQEDRANEDPLVKTVDRNLAASHHHDELMDKVMVLVAEQEEGLGFEDYM